MATKTKKIIAQTSENNAVVIATSNHFDISKPVNNNAAAPKIIMAQQKFGRWFVYFKGVAPKDNVGCGCKTASKAIRYMYLLKSRYGAVIPQNIFERLQFEAAREA